MNRLRFKLFYCDISTCSIFAQVGWGVVIHCNTTPCVLVKPNGCLESFSSFFVHEEKGLLWRFVVRLNRKGEGVVADEATITDEVAPVTQLVEVTKDIEVAVSALVPLGDGFVDGDIDTPDTSAVANGMSVVQTNDVTVDVEVGVVAVGNDEANTLVLLEKLSEVMVHVELKRVPLFGGDVRLLGDARVVASMANHSDVQVGLLQVSIDTSHDSLFSEHDGINRKKVVALDQFFVNRTADEVTQQSQHNLLDVRVTLGDVQQTNRVLEELVDALVSDLEVELVEFGNRLGLHGLLHVPVRCHHECGGLRAAIGSRLDNKRLRSFHHPQDGLILANQSFVLRHYQAVLVLSQLGFGLLFHLRAVTGDQLIRCRNHLGSDLLEVEPANPMTD